MKLLYLAGMIVTAAFSGVGLAISGFGGVGLTALCVVSFLILLSALITPLGDATRGSVEGNQDAAWLTRIALVSLFLRVVVSFAIHASDVWVYLGGDEGTFDSNGKAFAMWLRGDLANRLSSRFLDSHEVGYFYLVGACYYTFGISKAIPLFINALVGAFLLYPCYELAARWAGRLAARRSALIMAFFPSIILWSGLAVRDILVLFCIISILVVVERLRHRMNMGNLLALIGLLLALSTLRTYIFIILAIAIPVGLMLGRRSIVESFLLGGLLMVGLIALMKGTGLGHSELEKANLEYLAMMRRYNAMGPSVAGSLGTDVDISSPTAALTYLPLGLLYFYCSPLPWQIGSSRQVLSLLDLVLWYAMLPFIFRGMGWMLRHRFRAVLPLLFSVIGISVLYALVEGNIGIIFRHRAQIIVPLCVVAGVGYAARERERSREVTRREGPVLLHATEGGAVGASSNLRLPPQSA